MPPVRVSVVIPVFNAQSTLLRALDSVRRQHFAAHEVICVDDGSTDDSANSTQAWAARNGVPLRWISLAGNNGPALARNRGLDEARGELVAFLDADDAWHPHKLRLQVNALQDGPWDLLGAHSCVADMHAWPPLDTPQPLQPHAVRLWRAMLSNPFHTSSVLLRRDRAVRFPSSHMRGEDYTFWLEMMASGWRCAAHATPLSAMFKPAYGHGGLSADLMRMQVGELAALTRIGLRSQPLAASVAIPWSCAKFLRRAMLFSWRRSSSSTDPDHGNC